MRMRSMNPSSRAAMLLVILALAQSGRMSDALPSKKQSSNLSKDGGDVEEEEATKDAATTTKIFTNLNENYQSSSSSLDVVTKKLEEDIKERQSRMRSYWKRTFEDIRASNPVVFPAEEEARHAKEERRRSGGKVLERWKQFLDSGGATPLFEEEGAPSINGSDGAGGAADGGGDKSPAESPTTGKATASKLIPAAAPLRFDGFQTWEKQLAQWSEDVSQYLAETESQINELLQPRESSGYDLGNFGISSGSLKNLTRDDVSGGAVAGLQEAGKDAESVGAEKKPSKRRLGLDASASAPIGTLPIALTNLDPNLPPIPKPRPVSPGEDIVPHTDIADKSKNIWIVTTGALPWMTGTAVNPLLRAAYLCAGRREAGGSVTLMLPWVERKADQKRVYGSEERFGSPEDQEEYIRTWLRDTANMKEASVELNIRWYTAWQEVLENSLYSMGDIIGLIPVSLIVFGVVIAAVCSAVRDARAAICNARGTLLSCAWSHAVPLAIHARLSIQEEECDICVLEEPEHLNWYRAPGENWTSKFKHVVGIVHTNCK